MSFQRVLETARFTKMELAVLYGVSRQTIHTWSPKGRKPGGEPRAGSYTARMAMVITTALLGAVDKGLLPLGAMSREARAARVKSMAKTLQNLKPASL